VQIADCGGGQGGGEVQPKYIGASEIHQGKLIGIQANFFTLTQLKGGKNKVRPQGRGGGSKGRQVGFLNRWGASYLERKKVGGEPLRKGEQHNNVKKRKRNSISQQPHKKS